MNTCHHCRERKGKRSCPAYGQAICSLCCGTYRQREIDCPAHCTYLAQAAVQAVEEQRHTFLEFLEDPRSEEQRDNMLSFEIQGVVAQFHQQAPMLTDGDVESALCEARSRVSGLVLPTGPSFTPRLKKPMLVTDVGEPRETDRRIVTDLGELILQTVRQNSEDPHPCTMDDQKKILEDLIDQVRLHSRGEYRSPHYLNTLFALFSTSRRGS